MRYETELMVWQLLGCTASPMTLHTNPGTFIWDWSQVYKKDDSWWIWQRFSLPGALLGSQDKFWFGACPYLITEEDWFLPFSLRHSLPKFSMTICEDCVEMFKVNYPNNIALSRDSSSNWHLCVLQFTNPHFRKAPGHPHAGKSILHLRLPSPLFCIVLLSITFFCNMSLRSRLHEKKQSHKAISVCV